MFGHLNYFVSLQHCSFQIFSGIHVLDYRWSLSIPINYYGYEVAYNKFMLIWSYVSAFGLFHNLMNGIKNICAFYNFSG